ncbi:S-adenosyl-L-methionine-dependent methyltransferase [Xylariaceae sp. FL0255]|nr:S-adenosyl-L-methionine-dependent methyltransferase [Xylariaceae sp. FL0255]
MAAPQQKSITELATLIAEKTKQIEDGMKGQPGGDFTLTHGKAPLGMKMDASLEAVRDEMVEMMDELKARVLQPFGYMATLLLPNAALTVVFHCIYAFDIASHVPLTPGESITYEALASKCGMPLDDCRRVLQTAIAFRVFEEVDPSVSLRHNAVSAFFGVAPGARDICGLLTEEQVGPATKYVESIRRFPGSGEPGHSAAMILERFQRGLSNEAEKIKDPSKGLFDLVADDEKRVTRYRNAMGMSTRAPGYGYHFFLDTVPWSDAAQCPKTVVDIGGAGGDVCKQILTRHPNIDSATVLDLPEVVATAETPSELEGRLKFEPYNFLTQTVPKKGADAYIFRHIFHDWSDQYAVKIVKNLVPALKKGSKIWISEVVMPELSESTHIADQRRRGADLLMKVAYNGKERSKKGWEAVFAEADSRLRLVSVVQPKGAQDAVIEVVFDD